MAALTIGQISGDGGVATYATPAEGGDTFANNGSTTFLHVKNGNVAACVVTVTANAAAGTGLDDDMTVSVPAGEERFIGKFPTTRFPTTCAVACSVQADVQIAALKI